MTLKAITNITTIVIVKSITITTAAAFDSSSTTANSTTIRLTTITATNVSAVTATNFYSNIY